MTAQWQRGTHLHHAETWQVTLQPGIKLIVTVVLGLLLAALSARRRKELLQKGKPEFQAELPVCRTGGGRGKQDARYDKAALELGGMGGSLQNDRHGVFRKCAKQCLKRKRTLGDGLF